jgi:HK97 family phage portal protein
MQTPYQFKQFLWRCVMYRGNAFVQIQKDGAGRPIALYPLHPDAVLVRRELSQDGKSLVKVFDVMGQSGRPTTLPNEEVIHLMWDTEDGITGNSPIKQHALAFGWAFAMAEFGANFFKNGAHASLVVTIPDDVANGDDDKQQAFKDQFEKQGGVENAGKPFYVENGGKVEAISVTPEAAQYLDSRKFSRSEIAGICRVPSYKIGDAADMKYNNAEQQEQSYKNDGLMPWAVQFEEEATLKLLTDAERGRYVVQYDFNALLRADRKTRAEAHKLELQSGEKTLNEVRAENGDPPVEGGDVNLVMTNMTTYQAMNQNGWRPMKADVAAAPAEGG